MKPLDYLVIPWKKLPPKDRITAVSVAKAEGLIHGKKAAESGVGIGTALALELYRKIYIEPAVEDGSLSVKDSVWAYTLDFILDERVDAFVAAAITANWVEMVLKEVGDALGESDS